VGTGGDPEWESLEHILAQKKGPFVNGHFLVK
jgi:hypothetical protein